MTWLQHWPTRPKFRVGPRLRADLTLPHVYAHFIKSLSTMRADQSTTHENLLKRNVFRVISG